MFVWSQKVTLSLFKLIESKESKKSEKKRKTENYKENQKKIKNLVDQKLKKEESWDDYGLVLMGVLGWCCDLRFHLSWTLDTCKQISHTNFCTSFISAHLLISVVNCYSLILIIS